MGVVASSDRIYELVDRDVQVERVATGFTFTEGPVWNALGRYLLFSDMPADVRRRWSEERGAEVALAPAGP